MIDLYTSPTPNGWKVSVALEELGPPCTVHAIDLARGEQKTPAYLRLNPNGRIPTIVDRDNRDFAVFESGAILPHLQRWLDTMKARPACQRGIEVPFKVASALRDEAATQAFVERARGSVQR